MRPTSGSAIYRPDLGIAVMEHAESAATQYIGMQVLPLFPTGKQSSSFPVIPKEALLSAPDTSRSPRGKYNRGDWKYERGVYTTVENGWEEPVDDSERSMFDSESPGLADDIAVKRAWNHIMRGQEKRIADAVFNATTFTSHEVTTEWDTSATAVPVADVNTGRDAIRSACGMLPNTLIISWSTFQDLKNCASIVDRIKYTYPGIDINRMSSQQLAAVFDLERVLVGGAVYNSAGEGLDASIADLWNHEYAMLTITAPANSRDILQPCIGRTFLWSEDSATNPIVEVYRDEEIRSDIYRVRHNTAETLLTSVNTSGTVVSNIATACSYLLGNIHT